jgi:SAM-dependent methyltransferase
MADPGVAAYYDRLSRWNRVARVVGYGGGSHALTVHRGLADPAASGRVTTTRLHDVLAEQLMPGPSPRVLDAGCGLGGTMLSLAERWGGDYTGVTLSARQADAATAAIRASGRSGHMRVLVRSYDNPPQGPFDLIVAIESLIHSADPAGSLRALSDALAPGGSIVVVDDMPEASAIDMPELEVFRSGWNCGAIWSRQQYVGALESLRFRIVTDVDLTAACRPRSAGRIRTMTWLNLMAARILPTRALRAVMLSHRGGLALEHLLRTGHMRYRLLVASSSSSLALHD